MAYRTNSVARKSTAKFWLHTRSELLYKSVILNHGDSGMSALSTDDTIRSQPDPRERRKRMSKNRRASKKKARHAGRQPAARGGGRPGIIDFGWGCRKLID